jgi:hypothetical protein
MLQRGILLASCCVVIAGCAYLEGPRWALLGDTATEAFFIDRQEVTRLANGNYLYPVKVAHYRENQAHVDDESRETNRVVFFELNCRSRRWQETGSDVRDRNDRTVFKHLHPAPRWHAVEADTIQQVTYDYLCNNEKIAPRHQH